MLLELKRPTNSIPDWENPEMYLNPVRIIIITSVTKGSAIRYKTGAGSDVVYDTRTPKEINDEIRKIME